MYVFIFGQNLNHYVRQNPIQNPSEKNDNTYHQHEQGNKSYHLLFSSPQSNKAINYNQFSS